MFRASTNTDFVAPRVFQEDTPQDKRAVQRVLPVPRRAMRKAGDGRSAACLATWTRGRSSAEGNSFGGFESVARPLPDILVPSWGTPTA